jgi:hypothetical protein
MALIDRVSKLIPSASSRMGILGNSAAVALPGRGGVPDMPRPRPFDELGVSGLNRMRGIGTVNEEWLIDLSGNRWKQIYREMRDNDPVIGAMFFALETILRKAEWSVEPAKGPDGDNIAQFIRDCMDDMSHTWEDFIAECVSQFTFGFALFETVYKRRKGMNGKHASRFGDGLIGWRKFAPRAQESIVYWVWDEEGGLQGAQQLAPPDYKLCTLPIEKLMLFRTTSLKNNPEGRSILRNCYRPWFFKRRIEEVEGIGIERDLCGLPVLYATEEALGQMGGENAARTLVRNIRVDDQAGVVLPQAFDDKGNPLVKLELLKAAGAKQTDPDKTITRYNQDILNTMLAGFIQFGQTPTGSRSLHVSATEIFSLAITTFMDGVAAVMNRYAIPRLMALNQMDLEKAPRLIPGEIGVRDLEELADFVQKLSQAGLTFWDPPTVDYLRKMARLPKAPPEEAMPPAAQNPEGEPQPGQLPPGQAPAGSEGPQDQAEAQRQLEGVA